MDRVYLVHKETKASTEVPNEPDVLADFASRGWLPAERPGPIPFIPSSDGLGQRALDPKDYVPAPVAVSENKSKKVN